MNKIFILLDGLRRDFLKQYGYFIQNMPLSEQYLDKFQKLNCYSVSAWTPTVLSSIFTQKMPWEHGVLRPFSHSDKAILNNKLDNVNLSKLNGEKFFVTSNPWLVNGDNGFLEQWDKVDVSSGLYNYNSADIISNIGIQYLKDNYQKTFSVFLHFMDIHAPYSKGTEDFITNSDMKKIKNNIEDYEVDRDGMSRKSEIDYYYNACIRKIDYYLSNILKVLDELELWENTEVYIFADHGQNLEDRHAFHPPVINRHGLLFAEGVRVPMFVHAKDEYNLNASYNLISLFSGLKEEQFMFGFIANHYNKILGSIIDANNGDKIVYDYINEVYYLSNLIKDPKELKNVKVKQLNSCHSYQLLIDKLKNKVDIDEVKNKLHGNLITKKIY